MPTNSHRSKVRICLWTLPIRDHTTTQQEATNERWRLVSRWSHQATTTPTTRPPSIAEANLPRSQSLDQKHQNRTKIAKIIWTSFELPEFCSAAKQIKRLTGRGPTKKTNQLLPKNENRTLEMRLNPREEGENKKCLRFRGAEWREIPEEKNLRTDATEKGKRSRERPRSSTVTGVGAESEFGIRARRIRRRDVTDRASAAGFLSWKCRALTRNKKALPYLSPVKT